MSDYSSVDSGKYYHPFDGPDTNILYGETQRALDTLTDACHYSCRTPTRSFGKHSEPCDPRFMFKVSVPADLYRLKGPLKKAQELT